MRTLAGVAGQRRARFGEIGSKRGSTRGGIGDGLVPARVGMRMRVELEGAGGLHRCHLRPAQHGAIRLARADIRLGVAVVRAVGKIAAHGGVPPWLTFADPAGDEEDHAVKTELLKYRMRVNVVVEITVVEGDEHALLRQRLAIEKFLQVAAGDAAIAVPCEPRHLRAKGRGRNRYQPGIRRDVVVHQHGQGGGVHRRAASKRS